MRITLFSLTLATLLACSGDDAVSPPTPNGSTIGPAGGEIVGTEESGFPGFVLKIPPGALDKETEVKFEGVLDPTPLPPLADAVGPQVKILPDGLPLAKPASLTLPMEAALRESHESQASECKVWMREGAGWKRIEPTATTEESITIDISSFGVAGAGAFIMPKVTRCTACGTPITADSCVSSTGYCVTPIPDPPMNAFGIAAGVENETLYYLTFNARGQLAAASYGLYGSRTFTVYAPITGTPTGTVIPRGTPRPADNGNVWAAISGFGIVEFPRIGLVIHSQASKRPHDVITGPGYTKRLYSVDTSGTRTFFIQDEAGERQLATGATSDDLVADEIPVAGMAFFYRIPSKGVGVGAAGTAVNAPSNVDVFSVGPGVKHGVITSAESGRRAFAPVASSGSTLVKQVGFGPDEAIANNATFEAPAPVSSMAYDDARILYTVNNMRAEIGIIEAPNTGFRTLTLSSAAVDSPEYLAMIPTKVLRIKGRNELLLMVRGNSSLGIGRLFRVRKAGQ
jgi:hypothetical protein